MPESDRAGKGSGDGKLTDLLVVWSRNEVARVNLED